LCSAEDAVLNANYPKVRLQDAFRRRLDATQAARKPVLRWRTATS
jgi:glycine cleavage system protein P-like pyridoxal-binding family